MNYTQWRYYRKFLSQIYEKRNEYYLDESGSNNPNVSTTFECWHYTSMKALTNIFKDFIDSNENMVNSFNLYASNIRFMNDSQEYEDGRSLYLNKVSQSALKRRYSIKDYNADAYIVSFCKNGDLLSQWRGYGKESGISFCFQEENAMYKTYTKKVAKGMNPSPFLDEYTKPLPVIYNNILKEQYFDKLEALLAPNNEHAQSHLHLLGALFIPYCKNDSFFEERERRLVFYTTDGLHPDTFDYVYNSFGDYVKPALNITVKRKQTNQPLNYSDTLENNGPLISKMIVGPGANQQIVFNALIHIFDRQNRDNFIYLNNQIERQRRRKSSEPEIIDEAALICDRETHLVMCSDGKVREAHKCSNGLIIMKSAIPFRS